MSILPKLTAQVEERQVTSIGRYDNWTVVLDGWTDCSGNGIVAVMLCDQVEQHFLGRLELEGRHTAGNITSALKTMLADNLKSIKAISTDSASVMVKTRADFCAANPHIMNISCFLHVLNLVCRDVIKCATVKPWAQKISQVVVFFSNSEQWRSELKEWGERNN